MTPHEKKELWRWAVHNRIHGLQETNNEIRSTFIALIKGQALGDRVNLIERQMRIVELEIQNLIKLVGSFDYSPITNFPNEEPTDANVQKWFNEQLAGRGDLDTTWKEYQRCLSIYVGADDRKKWYLAGEALLRT